MIELLDTIESQEAELEEQNRLVKQEYDDWKYFHSHYLNAVKDLPVEWLNWFVSEIKGGASIKQAAWAATVEWDL